MSFNFIAIKLEIVNEQIEALNHFINDDALIDDFLFSLEALRQAIKDTPFILVFKENGYYDLTW